MPAIESQSHEIAWPALPLAPMENHWWHCTLYVSERGLSTSPMPAGTRLVTVEFGFNDHLLALRTAPDPDAALLQFLESTYEAAANCGRWNRAALERNP